MRPFLLRARDEILYGHRSGVTLADEIAFDIDRKLIGHEFFVFVSS
jgi:hypothetical protein